MCIYSDFTIEELLETYEDSDTSQESINKGDTNEE